MSPNSKRSVAVLAVCLPLFGLAGCIGGTNEPKPANRIAVLIDGSKTFDRRRGEAVGRAQELIDKIAGKPARRNQGVNDKVVVIAIDAMPAVLWRGTVAELRSADRQSWFRRFESRSDHSLCTDVDGAFRLAVQELGPSSPQIRKYMFVFSDLQHEPPADSLARCEKPRIGASDSFPWSEIEDTSVSVLWMPPGQILAWRRDVDRRGLSKSFHIFADSESGEIEPAPPPAARRVVTEKERRRTWEQVASAFGFGVKLMGTAAGLFIITVAAVGIGAAIRRRRQRILRRSMPAERRAQRV